MNLLKPIKRLLSKSFSKNPLQLLSQFPEDPYLTNSEFKAECKKYEKALESGFDLVQMFGTFEDNSIDSEDISLGPRSFLPKIKDTFLDYLRFCQENNSKVPLFFIRGFTIKYPESGVFWYVLSQTVLFIKGGDKTTETSDEFLKCLTNAAKYGSEYVKMDESGQLTIKPLF